MVDQTQSAYEACVWDVDGELVTEYGHRMMSYVSKLLNLGVLLTDEQQVTRFVSGLRDEMLARVIWREGPATFREAIEEARREMARVNVLREHEAQRKGIPSKAGGGRTFAMHGKKKDKGKGKGPGKKAGAKEIPQGPGKPFPADGCFRCGRTNHKKADCYATQDINGVNIVEPAPKAVPKAKPKADGAQGKIAVVRDGSPRSYTMSVRGKLGGRQTYLKRA